MNEKDIQKIMAKNLIAKGHKVVVPNVSWALKSEADIISVTSSNYVHEYEIKTSRQDFRSEMRAVEANRQDYDGSHKSYSMSKRRKHVSYEQKCITKKSSKRIPNKFWIVCVKDMVEESEIPKHWGLIEIDENGNSSDYRRRVNKIKRAKNIHTHKCDKDFLIKMGEILTYRYWSDDGEWIS